MNETATVSEFSEGNAYDRVLAKFTAYVGVQPKLVRPFVVGSHAFASNNQIMAIAPLGLTSESYEPVDESIEQGIRAIVERTVESRNREDEIKVSDLRAALEGIPTVHTRVPDRPCEKCQGRGALKCDHCESWYGCPECGSEGHFFKEGQFTEEFETGYSVKIGSAYLLPTYVRMLAEAAEALGFESVVHVRDETRNESYAEIEKAMGNGAIPDAEPKTCPYYQEFTIGGEFRVGIMPLITSGDDEPEGREIRHISK